MTRLEAMRQLADAIILEALDETCVVEGEPTVRFQRILDEHREAEARVLSENAPPKAA